MRSVLLYILLYTGMVACSPSRHIVIEQPASFPDTAVAIRLAQQVLVNDTALAGAHVGISIYDPAVNHYLYNYQGDHYFVPASNTKLFTCYAAMKYLGDSLVGARYTIQGKVLSVAPAGDPTFLHPDFVNQPLLSLLKSQKDSISFSFQNDVKKYGPGWGWDDYQEDYMPERSQFPVCGNVVWIYKQLSLVPPVFKTWFSFQTYDGEDGFWIYPRIIITPSQTLALQDDKFSFKRMPDYNSLYTEVAKSKFTQQAIPFITENTGEVLKILGSELSANLSSGSGSYSRYWKFIHSQPTDSLLKPMMHRSDNFFAEQSLLMVSNEKLGYMNDEAIIDTLLKNDLKDLPQQPVWVDGSGLSRYNEFTPQDIITVLLKIKNEFGLERIRNILPKGNTGTLTNYYEKLGPAIFAKTGSLSGQIALSGYLTCKSGKLLLFSILVNNHNSSGRAVRRAVEKFVLQVWDNN